MTKQSGAFLTIGELSAELNVPQHVLRYWETRFPALRPLQRAGNRRYYRPHDVELARRIHRSRSCCPVGPIAPSSPCSPMRSSPRSLSLTSSKIRRW
ncbi:MerR family transcriptional regulator [Sphingobium sp. DEHP117]|nr:MerR family transcriptional regulator [Sphingobium sp. DEHP117]MDQ4419208.1 MerR family transcriptional regulator [Sphingobium sp. DEHP117]